MTLKEWIQAERKAGRHWTMERVAGEVGIAPGNLSKAVNGKVEPKLGLLRGVHRLTKGYVSLMDWPISEKRTFSSEKTRR